MGEDWSLMDGLNLNQRPTLEKSVFLVKSSFKMGVMKTSLIEILELLNFGKWPQLQNNLSHMIQISW